MYGEHQIKMRTERRTAHILGNAGISIIASLLLIIESEVYESNSRRFYKSIQMKHYFSYFYRVIQCSETSSES